MYLLERRYLEALQNRSEIKESYFIEDLSTLNPLEENLDAIEAALFLFKIIVWLSEKKFDLIFQENFETYQKLWESRCEVAGNEKKLFMINFFSDLHYPNCSLVNIMEYCLLKKDRFIILYLFFSLIQNLEYTQDALLARTLLEDFLNVY